MNVQRQDSGRPHALVTGTSSGIGRAIALRLLEGGWQVTGVDAAQASIADAAFVGLQVDLADGAATDSALARLLASGASALPAAWVHAAGVLRTAPLGKLNHEDGERMWRIHVQAATRIADRVLPAMAAAGGGRAVLVGSRVAGGIAGRSQYAATKAALVSLCRSWAAEVVSRGVTVNVVSPAATRTAMLGDPARSQTPPRTPPIGRLIEPAEVAALVAFLLSADAAAITGQEIQVCGGASLEI